MKNFVTKLLLMNGLIVNSVSAMENDNFGYFSTLPKEIIVEILKYVIIEKKVITTLFQPIIFSSFHTPLAFGTSKSLPNRKEIKSKLFLVKNYRSFTNTCKTFNKIAKDKDIVNFIMKNSLPSDQANNAIFLYAIDYLEKIIEKNKTDKNYLSYLLHLATFCNCLNSVQFLLDKNVDVNYVDVDRDKETALHIAVQGMKLDMVALLIKNNASVASRNKWGQTVLDVARQRQALAPEIVKMLEERERQEEETFRNQLKLKS